MTTAEHRRTALDLKRIRRDARVYVSGRDLPIVGRVTALTAGTLTVDRQTVRWDDIEDIEDGTFA